MIAAVLASLPAVGLVTGVATEQPARAATYQPSTISRQLLVEHNAERGRVGVPPLMWNDKLAQDAQLWAQKLAGEGWLRHASSQEAGGAGENLWMGTAGYFAPETMIRAFVDEKQYYRHGAFPDVSRTGSWQDVGHYTQVIWRDTREVGCGLARGAQHDILVCRYWPAGNWMGQIPY